MGAFEVFLNQRSKIQWFNLKVTPVLQWRRIGAAVAADIKLGAPVENRS